MSVKDLYSRDEKGNLYRKGILVSKNKTGIKYLVSSRFLKIKRWLKKTKKRV